MKITRISLGPVNCYLVRSGTDAILIDSGNAESRDRLMQGLRAVGQPPEDIRLLVLTHGHSDHAGNAAWLRREYKIPVAIHAKDAAYVEKASNEIPPGTSFLARAIGVLLTRLGSRNGWEGFRPDHLLESDASLASLGLEAQLMEFPGHTPGSIGLLLPEGQLIAGDLVSNLRKPGLGMFAADVQRMRVDIRALEDRGVRTIYPGHGAPFPVEQVKGI